MPGKYDKYVTYPPHLQMQMKADKSVIFDGVWISCTGY